MLYYDVSSVTFLRLGPTATHLSLDTNLQMLLSKSILNHNSTLVALDVSNVLIANSPVFIELINTNCDGADCAVDIAMLAVNGVVADQLGKGYLHFALDVQTHES